VRSGSPAPPCAAPQARFTESTKAASRWRSFEVGSERLKKWKANCHGGRLR
jgi:hypothetical protein